MGNRYHHRTYIHVFTLCHSICVNVCVCFLVVLYVRMLYWDFFVTRSMCTSLWVDVREILNVCVTDVLICMTVCMCVSPPVTGKG